MLTPLTLGGLVAGFSVTHIGLSAVREPLIAACGATADGLGLVGRGWRLPEAWWPYFVISCKREVELPGVGVKAIQPCNFAWRGFGFQVGDKVERRDEGED